MRKALAAFTTMLALAACQQEKEYLPVPDITDPPRGEASPAPAWNAGEAPPPTGEPPSDAPPSGEIRIEPSPSSPPPPPPDVFLDRVDRAPENGSGKEPTLIAGASGPREALFIHAIARMRAGAPIYQRPICLTRGSPDLVASIARRFEDIHAEDACRWEGPGVVLSSTGEAAMFVHANVRCGGKSCDGEGGATYGNMGAEGYGYRLRRTREGWWIEDLGIMWIS